MNSIVDLYNILLSEGLIKSIKPTQATRLLKRNFPDTDFILDNGNMGDREIRCYTHSPSKQTIDKLLQFINNLGWFPSMIKIIDKLTGVSEEYPYSYSYVTAAFENLYNFNLVFLFEMKFDKLIEVPKYLYHLAPNDRIPKILKIGLVPKTRIKLSVHPDRIYLAFNEKGLDILEPQFMRIESKLFTRLQIDTSKLPKDFKLYTDPNFRNYGGYTLSNIPASAIKIIHKKPLS